MAEKGKKIPDATKEKAAEMCANPEYSTDREIIKSLPVSERTFYRWKNDQEFIDMVNRKVDKYTDRELPEVWDALLKQAKKGNTKAIKLYFELKDKYKQTHKIEGDNVINVTLEDE